jgi:glycosyltransferase involved in cell wall biosynthesis
MGPFVTALIPTGNRQHLIPLAISCALSQTYPNFEVLIVDDGIESTPVPEDPRLRYVRLNSRLLHGAKLNASVQHAQGEILMHFDDDDWSAPGRMQDQVDLLLSSGKQLVGYHEFLIWNTRDRSVFAYRVPSSPFCPGASQAYFRTWWENHKFRETQTGCDCVFSREACEAGQAASKDGKEMLVVRHHGHNTWSPQLGCPRWPQVSQEKLPPAFLAAIKKYSRGD